METAHARVRMDPEARKSLLKESAREVFSRRGYAASGLAEIAELSDVSKTLLYHYYPDGRPELYLAVMDELLSDLMSVVRGALEVPLDASKKLERLIESFLGFCGDNPDIFAILFREPLGSGEPAIVSRSLSAKVGLASEIASKLAASGAEASLLMTATTGLIGFLINVTELWLSDQVDRSSAVLASTNFILGGLANLDLINLPPNKTALKA